MSEEKREWMRKVSEELNNLVTNNPVSPEGILSVDALQECLKLNWAKKDENGNFIPTELGKAMSGRKGET